MFFYIKLVSDKKVKMSGRHHKPYEETQRGRKEAKKRENALKKQIEQEEKRLKAELNAQGLCHGPDGNVYTHAEVGRKFRARAWNTAVGKFEPLVTGFR